MSCSTLGPVGQKQMEFEAGPEKVVCTRTCETDIFFFQLLLCCYISQVIYKRWQWDDNPVLCRLHSPLQVNYSLRENFEWNNHLVYIIHQGVFIIVSSFSISAIAIDRCLAVGSALTALSARWSRCWMLGVKCLIWKLDVGV